MPFSEDEYPGLREAMEESLRAAGQSAKPKSAGASSKEIPIAKAQAKARSSAPMAKENGTAPTRSSKPRASDPAPASSSSSLVGTTNGAETAGWTPARASQLAALKAQRAALALERERTDASLAALKKEQAAQAARDEDLERQIAALSSGDKGKSKANRNSKEDFRDEREWTRALKQKMADVFDIPGFRLVQEGVCNANMAGRDIVCIMPTGGGKSLTYQLPALLQPGCTLVVSPLLALMSDQIMHLREKNVQAEMLTGSADKAKKNNIQQRLICVATGAEDARGELKLLYVTPEKIAKSKQFFAQLTKLALAGKLARIIIDEAHCVSQLGHDFRPDYKELRKLRTHFPNVPILALTATCPPAVLKDIVKILQLNPITPGHDANSTGTVHFSAPLYRANLRYKVFEKPAQGERLVQHMIDYILEHHAGESGIVYCYRKAETEAVAAALHEKSGGQISTGVYHADIKDELKERLHERWRLGQIKVVCATTAFGLGIDKADVRFVLHHTMSKSLENYYQESGRAGRDGKEAACVLYVRPQDAGGYADIVRDFAGIRKLEDMLRFGLDVQTCRKVAFAQHFSDTADVSLSSWAADGAALDSALAPCNHCDNCTRVSGTVTERDITLDAWRVLQIVNAAADSSANLTLTDLAAALRGTGTKTKAHDLTAACGASKIKPREAELTVAWLLLGEYLKQNYVGNAYSTNAYLVPGKYAPSLMGIRSAEECEGWPTRVTMKFVGAEREPRKSTGGADKGKGKQKEGVSPAKRKRAGRSGKGGPASEDDEGEAGRDGEDEDDGAARHKSSRKRVKSTGYVFSESDDDIPLAQQSSGRQQNALGSGSGAGKHTSLRAFVHPANPSSSNTDASGSSGSPGGYNMRRRRASGLGTKAANAQQQRSEDMLSDDITPDEELSDVGLGEYEDEDDEALAQAIANSMDAAPLDEDGGDSGFEWSCSIRKMPARRTKTKPRESTVRQRELPGGVVELMDSD